ncbi:MAG TPA: family 2A encapsulin nanocompartment shell protein [Polyangiaceae bacterium]
MAESSDPAPTLGAAAARQLANTTKTPPQWVGTTPRWLVSLLPWVPVEAGTYRVNKVKEQGPEQAPEQPPSFHGIGIECSPSDGAELPQAFVDYEENPREYTLSTVTTTLEVQTRISDLYRSPMDQVREQLGVLIEMVKERQENELVNNANYGLLSNAAPYMRVQTRAGAPTPDDLDELLTKVWKEPAFFLAHPRAIAAFGRECTRRGVPPPTTTLFGSPFLTWRGVPLIPSDKLHIKDGASNILLMRTGERKRGVVGLFQPGLPGEVSPSLTVRWMGINQRGAAAYLISLYCSAAVLTEDAVGVLENVQVGKYHEYRY